MGVDKALMELTMKLDIQKKNDSVHSWVITDAGPQGEDIRNYELKLLDAQSGHYVID